MSEIKFKLLTYHFIIRDQGKLEPRHRQKLKSMLNFSQCRNIINICTTDVQALQPRQVLHNQLEAGVAQLGPGHIEDLEAAQLRQGHHDTKFLVVHEGGVGDIKESQVLQGPVAKAANEIGHGGAVEAGHLQLQDLLSLETLEAADAEAGGAAQPHALEACGLAAEQTQHQVVHPVLFAQFGQQLF